MEQALCGNFIFKMYVDALRLFWNWTNIFHEFPNHSNFTYKLNHYELNLFHNFFSFFADMLNLVRRKNVRAIASELSKSISSSSLSPCVKRSSSQEETKKRAKYQKKPENKVRYQKQNHLPEFDSNKNATRCKNENCISRTHIFCTKCNVHLCIAKNRNCFKEFHILNK